MVMAKKTVAQSEVKRRPPAITVEAREEQLIALATNLAEKQLMEGTASSQVITHYLKLGSSKERLEKQLLEEQVKATEAKTEALKSAKRVEELYAGALKAMRVYSGHSDEQEDY
jgi:hypothetical protein